MKERVGKAKRVTSRMREALRHLERDPSTWDQLTKVTRDNLEDFDLAHPGPDILCTECHRPKPTGGFLTPKGRAQIRGLGLVQGGKDGTHG